MVGVLVLVQVKPRVMFGMMVGAGFSNKFGLELLLGF